MEKTSSDADRARKDRQAIVKHAMCVTIRAMRDLSRAEKAVFLALVHIWQFGGLWPSHETIAAEAGYSARHVRTALAKLRLRGLITWERRHYAGNQTSNLYRFDSAFWTMVRGDGSRFRQQPEPASASSRKQVPTNAVLLNNASTKQEGEPVRETPPPAMVREPASEAVSELRQVFAEERAAVYPDDQEHGTMRADRERAAVAQIEGLASEAVAWSAARGAPPERAAVRRELVRLMVRLWLGHAGSVTDDAPRGTLRERGHKLGLLAGDVGRFGRSALDTWQRANRPKRPELPPLAATRERSRPPVAGGLTFRVPSSVGRAAA